LRSEKKSEHGLNKPSQKSEILDRKMRKSETPGNSSRSPKEPALVTDIERRTLLATMAGVPLATMITTASEAAATVRPSPHRLVVENVVETTYGKIRGYRDQAVRIFKGVPYGRSPAGKARFLPAQPPEPWADMLDTTSPGPACPQMPLPSKVTVDQQLRANPTGYIMGLYKTEAYQDGANVP